MLGTGLPYRLRTVVLLVSAEIVSRLEWSDGLVNLTTKESEYKAKRLSLSSKFSAKCHQR